MRNQPESVKVAMVAALLAPAAAVAAARLGVGVPGPTIASAGVAKPAATAADGFTAPTLTPEQSLAARFVEGLNTPEVRENPFFRPAPDEALSSDVGDDAQADPVEEDAPEVEVTSIIGGRRPLAVIDGKPLSVGSEVADGWMLVAIDTHARTVTLEKDGKQISVELKPE